MLHFETDLALAPMVSHTFKLAAPIAYASGSFRSVKLAHPFKIERWSYERVCDLITDMEGPTEWSPDNRVDDLHCILEHGSTGHVVTAEVELDYADSIQDISKLHKELETRDRLLARQMMLISLFLSSPVMLSASYWFEVENGKNIMVAAMQRTVPHDSYAYGISYHEAQRLTSFLSNETPRTHPEFISIALDHWNHSYEAIPQHMQLVSLVTALEVLLNPAQTELKHRVTRLAAVLLGKSKDDSQEIYAGLGKVYDARSKVVHTGKLLAAKEVWYWQLRRWVSHAILYTMALKVSKSQLCKDLNQLGFGDGPSYLSSITDNGC